MANFSTFKAIEVATQIQTSYQQFAPEDSMNLGIALFTSGVNLNQLATGDSNGKITTTLTNEVISNDTTKYYRKPILLAALSPVYSALNPGSGHPPTVVPPTSQNGYAYFYNTQEIIWNNPPAAAWGTITHFALLLSNHIDPAYPDDSENTSPHNYVIPNPRTGYVPNTTVLLWGALATPKTVGIGDIFRFPIGALQINIY